MPFHSIQMKTIQCALYVSNQSAPHVKSARSGLSATTPSTSIVYQDGPIARVLCVDIPHSQDRRSVVMCVMRVRVSGFVSYVAMLDVEDIRSNMQSPTSKRRSITSRLISRHNGCGTTSQINMSIGSPNLQGMVSWSKSPDQLPPLEITR